MEIKGIHVVLIVVYNWKYKNRQYVNLTLQGQKN